MLVIAIACFAVWIDLHALQRLLPPRMHSQTLAFGLPILVGCC